ncbi:u1 small nuclear ribonucleoprotein a [Anaeramoeba flamelloides]|uniref:U1 small nuclear ribonucleoprotein a n=1 Tax=Anaeramoeba flamelloides TaxID=1746091 RepID=A0ABQ8ZBN5_9EUKA|nr:u1 small nuclear ribonucleoprotein a [Anaeramoeba flamelloides]
MEEISAKPTLYINGLNGKIKKNEMTHQLYGIFHEYGKIVNISIKRTKQMREQAFISFSDTNSAATAMKKLQNTIFNQNPLKISFAKTPSYEVMRRNGSGFQFKRTRRKINQERSKRRKQLEKEQSEKPSQKSVENETPTSILFLENLPEDANIEFINILFENFKGFVQSRLIPNQSGYAFVEFSNESDAQEAKKNMNNFKLPGDILLKISFANV